MNRTTAVLKSASRLLSKPGRPGDAAVFPVAGGANNRVYRVRSGGMSFLLKHYFRHSSDKRNRLDAEFSFCRFARDNALRCVPRPLARDPRGRVALYEYIEGSKIRPGAVTAGLVGRASDFFRRLNSFRHSAAAAKLPAASEACFSLARHLQCIEGRVRRLRAIKDPSPAGRKAAAFARGDLAARWKEVSRHILAGAQTCGLDIYKELPRRDRRISPSDFGFHNAIITPGGSLKFIDFEYAGWDDPAKTVNDFFCQPAVPVPLKYYPGFLKQISAGMENARAHRARIPVLFPAYQVKWCCILLNGFLPAGAKRRAFAENAESRAAQKELQLDKARRLLESIDVNFSPF